MATQLSKLGDVVGKSPTQLVKEWKAQWRSNLPKLKETRTVRILRVTAVLLADDDGTRSTATLKQGGRFLPAAGLLRNLAIHTKPGQSYIDDWISLANKQLFVSGANFLLDRANVHYVFEKDTVVNSITCTTGEPALELVAKKQKARGNNPWRDSVLMLFPWGPNAAPGEQGCSDIGSSFIKMPANYVTAPRFVDGVAVLGNNLLTHELGHFLGLPHSFPGKLHDTLAGIFMNPALNPLGLPFTEANLPQLGGLTKDDLDTLRTLAKQWIATMKFPLDDDAFFTTALQAGGPLVTDTPANLGMGLPAFMGDPIGSGDHVYEFERFDLSDMTGDDEVFGIPKSGAKPTLEKVPLNKHVRLNLMGYWYANVFGQKFSKLQVARMHHAIDKVRDATVDRTVKVTVAVSPASIDVTESLFSEPPQFREELAELKFALPAPHPREIAQALAAVRKGRPGRFGLGNTCAVGH